MNQFNTEKRKALVLEVLEKQGGIVYGACKAAGVSRTQFYEWRKTDPVFSSQVEAIQEKVVALAEGILLQLLKKGDRFAIAYTLNNKGRHLGYGSFNREIGN